MPFDSKKMRDLRLRLAMSQQDAADKAGFTNYQMWYQYESARIEPSIATAEKIARALGVSVCELIKSDTKGKK